ncbi:MAG: 30S ribosomal protein S8 [Omnitrophica WOR_2 bacterium GWB2_45_9]|nr:MAG: 30S ribosomal protein S8 [Omnitrophica WOR_2 bacterium GWB2_45_9]OGX45699.1 MAG: 30S ribosomal protein S8 [Omnitrophica WOR_2 bacterium RIFOXYA2_FULL_45_12]HBU08100.1 30S ribosomal protein S8 [Candidatus Omnitrophota bacterium]
MASTDPIADMLTVIRNAVMARKDSTITTASKINRAVLEILKAEGYIENFKEQAALSAAKTIKVYLKYNSDKKPLVKGLKRVSRPGLRVYVNAAKIPFVLRGFGRAIISTSRGLMIDKEARKQKLGGEVICYVW